jgi:hypothetical protein
MLRNNSPRSGSRAEVSHNGSSAKDQTGRLPAECAARKWSFWLPCWKLRNVVIDPGLLHFGQYAVDRGSLDRGDPLADGFR